MAKFPFLPETVSCSVSTSCTTVRDGGPWRAISSRSFNQHGRKIGIQGQIRSHHPHAAGVAKGRLRTRRQCGLRAPRRAQARIREGRYAQRSRSRAGQRAIELGSPIVDTPASDRRSTRTVARTPLRQRNVGAARRHRRCGRARTTPMAATARTSLTRGSPRHGSRPRASCAEIALACSSRGSRANRSSDALAAAQASALPM